MSLLSLWSALELSELQRPPTMTGTCSFLGSSSKPWPSSMATWKVRATPARCDVLLCGSDHTTRATPQGRAGGRAGLLTESLAACGKHSGECSSAHGFSSGGRARRADVCAAAQSLL